MPPINLFYIFITALTASLLVMPSLYNLSIKVGGVDIPDNERKVHDKVVPRIGGIAILAGLFIAILMFCKSTPYITGLITGGLIIFVVGFIDDLRELTAIQKLAGQTIGSTVGVILSQNHIKSLGDLFSMGNIDLSTGIAIPFTIFCIVGLINSLNMIDGLDGLAGGVSAIASLALAILAFETSTSQVFLVSIALLGAIIGFLAHNSYPARIFMGDAGSNLLGFTLGMQAVRLADVSPTISPVAILAILSVPVFDTLYVISRRLVSGRAVMGADSTHLHHRLLDIGLSHKASVLVVYGWAYLMAAVAVIFNKANDALLFMFLMVSTFAWYLLLFVVSKYFPQRYGALAADIPLLNSEWASKLREINDRLLTSSRYLILIIMALTLTIKATQGSFTTVITSFLLIAIAISYACKLNQLLLISLYSSGAYLIFIMDNFGRSSAFAGISTPALSACLFGLLSLIIGAKTLMQRRFNTIMNSAIEFPVLLAVIFVPLVPDQIAAKYHLLSVAGKSIILFVAYKYMLISDDTRRNRVVILASSAALLACFINRI